ncbi:MAG: cytochrome P450, partial [Lentimonas sp.]
MPDPQDPFKESRQKTGTINVTSKEGEDFPLVLRLKDVRKTAKDWKTFSSDNPLMCVIHSEADVRGVRQLPLEIDPPKHTDYRNLVQPLFNRPRDDADYIQNMEELVDEMVSDAIEKVEIDAVRQFALPLQSRALTRLLKMPES